DGRKLVLLHGRLGSQNHPARAIGDLRGVTGRHSPVRPFENRFEVCELFHGRVGPDAVVVIEKPAVATDGGNYLSLEETLALRPCQPAMALQGIAVGRLARNPESV